MVASALRCRFRQSRSNWRFAELQRKRTGLAPSMTDLLSLTAVSSPVQCLCVLLHHRAEHCHPGARAEPLKARPDSLPGVLNNPIVVDTCECGAVAVLAEAWKRSEEFAFHEDGESNPP